MSVETPPPERTGRRSSTPVGAQGCLCAGMASPFFVRIARKWVVGVVIAVMATAGLLGGILGAVFQRESRMPTRVASGLGLLACAAVPVVVTSVPMYSNQAGIGTVVFLGGLVVGRLIPPGLGSRRWRPGPCGSRDELKL